MEAQELSHVEESYEPTQEQAERDAALRRFNLLFVYGPIGLVSAVVIGVVIILLAVALSPDDVDALLFISGLADAVLVIALVPSVIIGVALLGLITYSYVRARQQGMAPIRQTQRLLWRMDNVVGRLLSRTKVTASMVARPFITANGVAAYIRALLNQILKLVKRS